MCQGWYNKLQNTLGGPLGCESFLLGRIFLVLVIPWNMPHLVSLLHTSQHAVHNKSISSMSNNLIFGMNWQRCSAGSFTYSYKKKTRMNIILWCHKIINSLSNIYIAFSILIRLIYFHLFTSHYRLFLYVYAVIKNRVMNNSSLYILNCASGTEAAASQVYENSRTFCANLKNKPHAQENQQVDSDLWTWFQIVPR